MKTLLLTICGLFLALAVNAQYYLVHSKNGYTIKVPLGALNSVLTVVSADSVAWVAGGGGGPTNLYQVGDSLGVNNAAPNSTFHIDGPVYTHTSYNNLLVSSDNTSDGADVIGAGIVLDAPRTLTGGTNRGSAIYSIQTGATDRDAVGIGLAVRKTGNSQARIQSFLLGHNETINGIGLAIGESVATSSITQVLSVYGNIYTSGEILPDVGFSNSFMYFKTVPDPSATWANGAIVLLHEAGSGDTGDDNHANGIYFARRSATTARNAVSVNVLSNTDDSGNVSGMLEVNTIDTTVTVALVTCDYHGEKYAALRFTDDLLNTASFYYGIINNTGAETTLDAIDIDSVTNVVVINDAANTQTPLTSKEIYADYTTVKKMGIGVDAPDAALHLKAGTATAGTAPLKMDGGVILTTPENFAIENDSTDLYWTNSGGTRKKLAYQDDIAYGNASGTPDVSGQFTITHGLGSTPTAVVLTNETSDSLILQATRNSTTITVTVRDETGAVVVGGTVGVSWVAYK